MKTSESFKNTLLIILTVVVAGALFTLIIQILIYLKEIGVRICVG